MTASNGDNGNRTHEPSLRELTADLDGLKELSLAQIVSLREVIDERDRLYKERDEARRTAVDAALAAAKEAVNTALTAADRAVAKAETANEKRFDAANEFRGQLADQASTFYTRREADIRFDGLTEKVDNLRTSRDKGMGGLETETTLKGQSNQDRALYISIIIAAAIIAATFIATHH